MSGAQRRAQLLDVGRELFARRGYAATSVEELAARAGVSKPVVYEHFGGKEALHAAVADRELRRLLDRFGAALAAGGPPRTLLEGAAAVLLDYVADDTDGFRVLSADSPASGGAPPGPALLGELAARVGHVLAAEYRRRGLDPGLGALHSQAFVGMVALVGQWWLPTRSPGRAEVVGALVDLAWDGLARLRPPGTP
ncbi:TetR family transcriptional regulator [Geodermatophilus sp. SYSU D00758]